jgi:hypothetical protein
MRDLVVPSHPLQYFYVVLMKTQLEMTQGFEPPQVHLRKPCRQRQPASIAEMKRRLHPL